MTNELMMQWHDPIIKCLTLTVLMCSSFRYKWSWGHCLAHCSDQSIKQSTKLSVCSSVRINIEIFMQQAYKYFLAIFLDKYSFLRDSDELLCHWHSVQHVRNAQWINVFHWCLKQSKEMFDDFTLTSIWILSGSTPTYWQVHGYSLAVHGR